MSSFADLKRKVLRLLYDEPVSGEVVAGGLHSAALLKDSLHAALDAILPWVWKRATFALGAGESAYAMPDDLFLIEGVLDSETGQFLAPAVPTPGGSWGETGMTGNAWMECPRGYLTLSAALASGGTLFYQATWTKPENEAENVEIPLSAETGLVLYAASYCLLPDATQAASLGQYKQKVDAGSPTDNPVVEMSSYFLKRFEIEMNRLPMKMKGGI